MNLLKFVILSFPTRTVAESSESKTSRSSGHAFFDKPTSYKISSSRIECLKGRKVVTVTATMPLQPKDHPLKHP